MVEPILTVTVGNVIDKELTFKAVTVTGITFVIVASSVDATVIVHVPTAFAVIKPEASTVAIADALGVYDIVL